MNAKQLKLQLLQERERRKSLPVNQYQPDNTPDRDQLSFHSSSARYRLVFGGNRSGKSVCSSYEIAAFARGEHRFQEIPPGPKQIYVLSAEYRTLYMGIHRHLASDRDGMKFIPSEWIKNVGPRIPGASVPIPAFIEVWCKEDEKGNRVTAETPDRPFSVIWFISGEGGEQARKKIQAAAVDLAIIDEEIDEVLWSELQMRLLDRGGRVCISCTLVRSEDWLLALEDRAEENDPVINLTRLNTESSKHLDDFAKKEILASLSNEERAIRVQGRSRRSFGLVYPNFNDQHIFQMDDEFLDRVRSGQFTLIAATDPGFRIHAGLWCAFDEYTKTAYFYRELYERETSLDDLCHQLVACEGYQLTTEGEENSVLIYSQIPASEHVEKIETRLIDPAAFRMFEDGSLGIAAQMISYYGFTLQPANNSMEAGVEAVRRLLMINPTTGKPHIRVASNLKNFLSERRRYKFRSDVSGRNTHATKAEPIRKNNHLMDCWKYICLHLLQTYSVVHQADRNRYNNQSLGTTTIADRMQERAEAFRQVSQRRVVDEYLGSSI